MPVYNTQVHLKKCLNSLLNQDLKNYEVIIVNDSSPDDSQAIIDEFTAKYKNFRCIVQPNGGVGSARNNGILNAKANTITFVDSDDFVRADFISKMYCSMQYNNTDVAYCEFYYSFENGFKVPNPRNFLKVEQNQKFMPKLMSDIILHHYPWNKMYKKSLFIDNDIFFPQITFEDPATMPRVFMKAKSCSFVHNYLYYYNQRRGSALSNHNCKRIQSHVLAIAIMRSFIDKTDTYNTLLKGRKKMISIYYLYMILEIFLAKEIRQNKAIISSLKNILSQLALFKLETLPIKGEVWQELVVQHVYKNEPLPNVKFNSSSYNKREFLCSESIKKGK